MRPPLSRVMLACATVVVIGTGAFLAWALTPLGPAPEALSALAGNDSVTVSAVGEGWEFTPRSAEASTGLIFYPGGRVDARSYAPLCREVAARGYRVVLVRMPLSLAVLDADAARGVVDARPDVGRWVLGGHSLGGAMAASAVAGDPTLADGLLLLAAYATGEADLSTSELEVADVTASEDEVLDQENWETGRRLLPPGTSFVRIEGGNHAQFGSYGPQPGDGTAAIAPNEQLDQTVRTTVALLERVARQPR